jgi:hypothetical protein
MVNVTVDNTPPNNPDSYLSSHTVNQWSDDNTVFIEWTGASDAISGVSGYSILWSTSPELPVDTVDTTVNFSTSNPVADGKWYANIRTVDGIGNWNNTYYSVGPFNIDITPPTLSDPLPINGMIFDSKETPIRLEINCSDPTTGISSTNFRYRFDMDPWSNWESHNGSSGDIYWFDIPRDVWINYMGSTLYWEVNVTDGSGLVTRSSTFNGVVIVDDDESGPSILNPWSVGDIDDTYLGDYRIQVTLTDKSGIDGVFFRYRYGSNPWNSWQSFFDFSGSDYWYNIPRTDWSNYVGETIYWEVYAQDGDNDRIDDGLITYSSAFSNILSDDDPIGPLGLNPTQDLDIFDSDPDDYTLQMNWIDNSGIKEVGFRYKFDSGNFTLWQDHSRSIGSTYYYDIPRLQWIEHIGETIYFESYAIDGDDDRIGDGESTYSTTYLAGVVTDDDIDAPMIANHIESYENDYRIGATGRDWSGWAMEIEYYYSSDPATIYTLTNSTFQSSTYELTITVPKSQLIDHLGETISWRYQCTDLDNDRSSDSLNTNWSSWIIGSVTIDKYPPITECSLQGILGNYGWYTSDVQVNLSARDDGGSGIEYIKYRFSGGSWETYSDVLTITQEGSHIINFYSEDISGNVEERNTFAFMIDKHAPETVIVPDGTSSIDNNYCSDVDIQLVSSDDKSGLWAIEYRLNNGEWQNYKGTFQISAGGNYSLEYRSIDIAGNIEEIDKFNFTLDFIHPEITSTTPQNGKNGVVSVNSFVIEFSEPMDTASVENNLHFYPEMEIEEYSWSNNNEVLEIRTSENFKSKTTYYMMISQDAKDTSGNPMGSSVSTSFKTGEREEGSGQLDLLNMLLLISLLIIVILLIIMLISSGGKFGKKGSDYETNEELEQEASEK